MCAPGKPCPTVSTPFDAPPPEITTETANGALSAALTLLADAGSKDAGIVAMTLIAVGLAKGFPVPQVQARTTTDGRKAFVIG